MTWEEFKQVVDDKIKETHLTENIDIWYIDICYPERGRLEVYADRRDGLTVQQ